MTTNAPPLVAISNLVGAARWRGGRIPIEEKHRPEKYDAQHFPKVFVELASISL
jgi:hypothetical protein